MQCRIISSLIIFVWLTHPFAAHAILLDRILAVVNGQVISLSDVERELTFFGNGRHIGKDSYSDAEVRDGMQRLIDHTLLLAEANRFAVEEPEPSDIEKELERIQKQFGSTEIFELALQRHAITQRDLEQRISEGLQVQRFINQRISFFTMVFPDEVERYYDEHPEEFEGKTFEEAQETIRNHLTQKKEIEKLEEFLSKLNASIQINFE